MNQYGKLTCIAATYLLEKLSGRSEKHATKMLCLATSEQGTEWRVTAVVTRRSNAVHDDVCLQLGFIVVDMQAPEGSDDSHTLLRTVFGEKPPRRLWEPEHENADQETEEDLKRDW